MSKISPITNNNTANDDDVIDYDDVTVVPAIVIVCVLATPILLVFVALIIQHVRTKQRVKRAVQKRSLGKHPSKKRGQGSCCCCCFPAPTYYYDSERGFDRLVKDHGEEEDSGNGNDVIDGFSSTDDEEEDLFTRKA